MRDNLEHSSVTPAEARSVLRAAPAVIRAGIYVRISSDRTGAGLGVARQEEDGCALCSRQGWTVCRVYVDSDVPACSGKRRPAWDDLLAGIAAGLISAVVCWHVGRLTRSPRELGEVIDLHDRRGIVLATVTGEMDLSASAGRMLARMLGAAARHEAEHQAERRTRAGLQKARAGLQKARAGLQKARAGLPHKAGSRRGCGYGPGGVTIVEAEAAIVREARDRVMAGESPRSVAAGLNDRGITSATGQKWSAEALRKILMSGRISGCREHHGVIVHEASWPPVIPAAGHPGR